MWSYFVDYILDFSAPPHIFLYMYTFLHNIAIGAPPHLPAIKIAKY